MDNTNKIKKLQSFSLFKDLPDTDLFQISEFFHEKDISPKTIFISQASDSDAVYFIYSGLARAYRITDEGQEVNLSVLGAGEIIGEMGILEELPRSANVEAMQKTQVLVLIKKDFIELLKTHPKIPITLLKFLSKRLRNITDRVEDVMSKSIEERTFEALQILSKLFPDNQINLSHEELASIIGATRARVTEVLDILKDKKKIELHHRRIKLL